MPNNIKKAEQPVRQISWEEVYQKCQELADQIKEYFVKNNLKQKVLIAGIPNGGLIPAAMLSMELNLRGICAIPDSVSEPLHTYGDPVIYVDDIIDSGDTIAKYLFDEYDDIFIATTYQRYNTHVKADFVGEIVNNNDWLKFGWRDSNG